MKVHFLFALIAAGAVSARVRDADCGAEAYRCKNLQKSDSETQRDDEALTIYLCDHLVDEKLCTDRAGRIFCNFKNHVESAAFKWFCEEEGQQYTFEKAKCERRCENQPTCSVS